VDARDKRGHDDSVKSHSVLKPWPALRAFDAADPEKLGERSRRFAHAIYYPSSPLSLTITYYQCKQCGQTLSAPRRQRQLTA
jgi:hypothetical protein